MLSIDFERVFEALPSPYMLLDRNLRYVAANATYLATTERTMDELRGQYVMDMFPNPDDSGRRLRASFEHVVATGESDTLAYLPYPIALADGGYTNRYWTAVHTPIFDDAGEVAFVLQNTVDVTEFALLREAASVPRLTLDAETSLIQRTREAEESSAEFRRLFQQAPGFFAVLSGPEHIFSFTSDAYQRLIGGRHVIGRTIREALPEVIEQGFVDLLDTVYESGKAHSAEGALVMLENEPGKSAEETYLDFSYDPIRAADGTVSDNNNQNKDHTKTNRTQQRQRLLIAELNHRVKNALATVQSIASLTLRSTDDVAGARAAFEARIVALAQAHNMLSERNWSDADIGSIVRQELSAYDSAHVRIGGPDLIINAKATVALALVMHELTTNAAKHGALSAGGGTLAVSWHETDDDHLVIDWVERGGPPAAAPRRRGFGSRLLNTVVTGELGGTLDLRYEPAGLSATLTLPANAYRPPTHAT